MEAFERFPRIAASDLTAKAVQFADHLVRRLDEINHTYPMGDLDRRLDTAISGPTPEDFRPIFETLFCRHMASRYIIVPD
jgi:hypothetical protein